MNGHLRILREDEVPAAARSAALAFASDVEGCARWLRDAGLDACARAFVLDGQPAGYLLRLPMGQFVHGQRVPMVGVAGVSVPPERRGGGVARAMMERFVVTARQEGFALSTLFPSTQPLYRAVGYEHSATRFEHALHRGDLAGLRGAGSGLDIRPVTAEDPAVRALHRRFAAGVHGALDREEYVWARVSRRHRTSFDGFGLFRGEALEGYVFVAQTSEGEQITLRVQDFAYGSRDGAEGILAFLDRFTSVVSVVRMYGGPTLPMLSLLEQQWHHARRAELAMTRVLDVRRALETRGYPAALEVTLGLRVRDALVPENDGAFTLRVLDGRGTVTPGADPPGLSLDVRWLAPMYMGLHRASTLAGLGVVEGDPASLARADALFSAEPPAVADYF
jgi:predicted acetyltransferase